MAEAARLVAAIPVVLTAFCCHFNVHPLMYELENFSEKRIMKVANIGLGKVATVNVWIHGVAYVTVANMLIDCECGAMRMCA
eukprot:scaffold64486_cov52-Prasinocladus_malaysianus.AAC.2